LTFASISLPPVVLPAAALAQEADVEALMQQLADPHQERWMRIERQILRAWGQSGSATVDYLFQRGEAALQAGQAAEAINHFSAVLDYAPDFAEAWNGRATAYFLANRLGQSMSDIEQVLRLNPRHFGALTGMGMILEQLERPEEALVAYRASLAVHPHQQSVIDAVRRLELASAGQSL
jgi:Flp pilus assembly protein TadD, contains TPR repeats